MQEIDIRSCPIATVKTRTHKVVLAGKVDIPDANKIINDFFNKFEIIRIVPNVRSGEINIQQKDTEVESHTKNKLPHKRVSVLSQYYQIQDILNETFSAKDYHRVLSTISDVQLQSVYAHFGVLIRKGKITMNNTSPITYTKIERVHEPMPSMIKERRNLIDSVKT